MTLRTVHATTVAFDGRAILIRGASGRGKSSLGLQLIALGGGLVADDRTCLERQGDRVIASCPAPIRGRIEARGIGILRVPVAGPCAVGLVVDLDRTETARLPEPRHDLLLGVEIPLVLRCETPAFAASLATYVRYGPDGAGGRS